MSMRVDIAQAFEERLEEINAYLALLASLERQVQTGPPQMGGEAVTAQQQRILYSSIYLQIYNLVEATATWCIQGVAYAATDGGRWLPGDLTAEIRREWVRFTARTHTELSADHRLVSAVEFCDQLVLAMPVKEWKIEKGGGGNWDDEALEILAIRIGVKLDVRKDVYKAIKRPIREDCGPLRLVKLFRNKLAHGSISFSECGENVTVSDLKEIKEKSELYLREVIRHFREFIDGHLFIIPNRRPVGECEYTI